jgi:hypothetical protein
MEHLVIYPDHAVTWKENQIAIEDGVKDGVTQLLLCISDEDFENGEFTDEEKQDVLDNLDAIKAELKSKGYAYHVYDDEDEDYDEDEGLINPKSPSPNTANSGKEIYLLYFGRETGSREDCSVFYETPEVWEGKADAKAREKALNAANTSNNEFWTHLVPVTVK